MRIAGQNSASILPGRGAAIQMVDAPPHQPPGKWFRGTSFKVEAAIFLLLVATFAAMLGQNAITRQRLTLAPEAGTFAPYAYSDHDNAGASSISLNPAILSWTCTLRSGFTYPYCGYGMLFDPADNTKGRVFSNYETITLRLIYHGPPGHLKLLLKNFDPKYSRAGAGDSTKPNVAEFAVVDGENEIHLTRDQFVVDQWWATSHHLSPEQAKPEFGNVIAVDILSGSRATLGTFSVAVQSIVFEGIYLSSAQWYLVIISVWLVLTAIFLVYRMFRVRRGYEDRQQRQVAESRELVAARTEAEAASAAKSQFLANMSHELRTPLNAILGYAQLLRNDGLTERQLSAVQTINQSGEHLLALITDLLDLSKVEAGRLELLPAPFDLRATVDNVAQMIRLRAEEKDLRFIVEISGDVPRHLVGDRKRIRQVLINLLGNAIKFTTAGEVRLTVSTVSWEGGNVRLRFDVLDTGPGIRSDQLNLIFQPFEQVGSARDRIGGTGLGLSITRQIVEVMEGQIDVMSTVGKGSRFRVEASFPLAAVELPAPGAASGAPAGGAGCEVLVVDDVAANRTLLRDVLENRGYRVREAADGLEAVELAEAAAPDLILMDLKMPVLDGLEAMRRLQHRQALRMIPIIAISANPTAEMEAEVRAAGAEGLLAKPIDLTQLHRCIEDLLVRRQEDGIADGRQPMTIPPADQMIRLLTLARTGNMRAVRTEASTIFNLDPQYRPFALRLEALAAAYQSPAVLRLIEQHIEAGEAA